MELIDISVSLGPGLPTWPGSPGVSTVPLLRRGNGDIANASELRMDVHCGTHVDAPRHFVDDGKTIDQIQLSQLSGRALVIQVPSHITEIGASELASAVGDDTSVRRLLLRTANSEQEGLYERPFYEDYAAVSPDGAVWLADRAIDLVGIDYLSIQRFHDPPDTHEILLGADVAILEGLNLAAVEPGWYDLHCLPILIHGAEAAPARVALSRPTEV